MSAPSVESLLNLEDGEVTNQAISAFRLLLQSSQSVKNTYFASQPAPPVQLSNQAWEDWTDRFAVALVCASISHTSICNFAATVNGQAAESYWQNQLKEQTSTEIYQYLYRWAFPTYCTDGTTTFADYLQENEKWATALADVMTSKSEMNEWVGRLEAHEAGWMEKLNLVFYKLHLLDPAQEARTVAAWTKAYPQVVEQWQTYDYLPRGNWGYETFFAEVNGVIGSTQVQRLPNVGGGGPGGEPEPEPFIYYTVYGEAVCSWLFQRPSEMGLKTWALPENFVPYSPG